METQGDQTPIISKLIRARSQASPAIAVAFKPQEEPSSTLYAVRNPSCGPVDRSDATTHHRSGALISGSARRLESRPAPDMASEAGGPPAGAGAKQESYSLEPDFRENVSNDTILLYIEPLYAELRARLNQRELLSQLCARGSPRRRLRRVRTIPIYFLALFACSA